MSVRPLLTICIPAYNRAEFLEPLMQSILNQEFNDFNILVCEDGSPQRQEISDIVKHYQDSYPKRIHYFENELNLGYDGNIRRLVELASGQYCLFMGNDDLLCEGALQNIADILNRVPDCGVIVRSYATFDLNSNQPKQLFRYFPEELIISSGADAIAVAYRRSVVIPGMVIRRDSAEKIATERFDGTLLYQLYLVGRILATSSVVFTPKIIALRRDGIPPDFGNSTAEKGLFSPKEQTPESSINFVNGMLNIARYIEENEGVQVFKLIFSDIGSYSYPILSIQANRSKTVFISYAIKLGVIGFWQFPLFHFYFFSLLFLGRKNTDTLIKMVKDRLGYTPRLGRGRRNI